MRSHRRHRVLLLLALVALFALSAPAAHGALKKAKDLGPTPVENDCLIYKGKNPCYYGLWSGRFVVDKHILNVGDVMTATIQTYAGLYPAYSWVPEPGLPAIKRIACPITAPAPPKDGSPNYFTLMCTFRAKKKTGKWVVFGPSMGLASSSYVDGDYYAVVSGSSVSGRVLDGEGKAVPGVRVTITGPDDVYAVTDAAGFYDAIELSPGKYRISIGKSRFCHDTGAAISKKSCRKSVTKVLHGSAEVHWRGLGKYAIYGRVRDEFKRGLAGVKLKATGLPGGEALDVITNKDGSYRIGFEGAATVSLASEKGGLPNAFYYVVKADGTASSGQSADVTPSNKEPQVKVDWELDRRLYYSNPNAGKTARAPANGFSRYTWIGQVLTQHGDPAPNVPIQVDPLSDNPAGAVCSVSDQLLWPTTFADGVRRHDRRLRAEDRRRRAPAPARLPRDEGRLLQFRPLAQEQPQRHLARWGHIRRRDRNPGRQRQPDGDAARIRRRRGARPETVSRADRRVVRRDAVQPGVHGRRARSDDRRGRGGAGGRVLPARVRAGRRQRRRWPVAERLRAGSGCVHQLLRADEPADARRVVWWTAGHGCRGRTRGRTWVSRFRRALDTASAHVSIRRPAAHRRSPSTRPSG